MNKPGKATHKEICDNALKHYEEIAKETCNWCSTVPEAIKFFRDFPLISKIKQFQYERCNEFSTQTIDKLLAYLQNYKEDK